MSTEIIEPPDEPAPLPEPGHAPSAPPAAKPVVHAQPSASEASSTSGDELSVSLAHARPDPLLGELVVEEKNETAADSDRRPRPEPARARASEAAKPKASGSRAEALGALSGLALNASDAANAARGTGLSSSSHDALAALDLGQATTVKGHHLDRSKAKPDKVDEDEDDEEPRSKRTSWVTILLASYASAVSLGLIWTLWTQRRGSDNEIEFPVPTDSRPDPGRRADHARRIVAPPPIDADHITSLGKRVSIGEIEITPLAVTSGAVKLARGFNGRESKNGGAKALKLRLRLKNASTDLVLAPLDEAFLRERVRAEPDSYIETAEGGPPIPLYPLAVESEWSIVGQEFRELKPGESFETLVVSAPDALARKTAEMTWRIRLRTDINHTDDLGVRFQADEIKPEPEPRRRP